MNGIPVLGTTHARHPRQKRESLRSVRTLKLRGIRAVAHPSMRYLFLSLALALPASAQSGTFTVPSTYTNNVTNIGPMLPVPDPGRTSVRLEVTSKFDQGLTVSNGFPVPVTATCRFTNRVELRCGAIVFAEGERTTEILGLVCDFGVTKVRRSQFVSCAATVSLNLFTLVGPPTVYQSTRAVVAMDFPFGEGVLWTQTTSRAGFDVQFNYLP